MHLSPFILLFLCSLPILHMGRRYFDLKIEYINLVLISVDRRWPSDSGDPRDLCGERGDKDLISVCI